MEVIEHPLAYFSLLIRKNVRVDLPQNLIGRMACPRLDIDIGIALGMEIACTVVPQIMEPEVPDPGFAK